MRQIKVGIIGAGAIAHEHCVSINTHPHAQVVAIAELHPERREAFAKKYNLPRSFATPEELIADPDVDAVSIGVPNMFHAPLATMALQAGKHVMLEKPFARNLSEALPVAKEAKRSGKILMVGMNCRYYRNTQTAKAIIERGTLGEIYHGKATWLRRGGIPKLGTWFCRKDMAGGGTLLDIGVHLLDMSLYLMNNFQPQVVSGVTYSKFGPRGLGEGDWGQSDRGEMRFDVEDFATALIKLKGGATVSLDVSWACHQETPYLQQLHLFGTDAGAALYPSTRIFQRHEDGDYITIEPRQDSVPFPACCRFHNWIDAILGTAPPLCPIGQSLAVQMILDAIYESACTGREVRTDADGIAAKLGM